MIVWKDSLRKEYVDGREDLRRFLVDELGNPLEFMLPDNIKDSDIGEDLEALNYKLDLITDGFSKMSGKEIYFYIIQSRSPLTAYCHKLKEAYVIVLDADTAIYIKNKIKGFYGKRKNIKLPDEKYFRVDHIIYSTYLYIYFHEMAHVARGHLDYPHDDSEPRLGTECDADLIGTLLAYKNISVIASLSNIDAKILTFLGIYWTFRTLDVHNKSMSKSSIDYPSALARIALALNELARLDYSEDDLNALVNNLIENENIVYKSGKILKREKRMIKYIRSKQVDLDLAEANQAREDIMPRFMPYRMKKLEV